MHDGSGVLFSNSKIEKSDFCVFISRFQPMTIAHCSLINQAFKEAKKVIVIIGSSANTISTRNPFTAKERTEMIRSVYGFGVIILQVEDSAYNFNLWLKDIQEKVTKITKNGSVKIIGMRKDASSYYLNYFPNWEFVESREICKGLSATKIRDGMFLGKYDWIPDVDDRVFNYLLEWKEKNSERNNWLKEEFLFLENYKEQWKKTPYSVTFVTTDALILCLGHILLIERGRNPFKGSYALAGGFLNQDETLQECAIRELKEETKIKVSYSILKNSLRQVKVFDSPIRDPRGRFITHVHVFNLDLQELPEVKSGDDASSVRWVQIGDLNNIKANFAMDHYQIIKNILNTL
jgi:bifunctional NMN adenylyltransferase/nudix hydrolase